ncbi:MAG: BrnT family toxin [Alphaproteobacteria bacterium]|nr:MAG: BrnT family toxin [Alphaproteobacteria bacterium]TAF15058.1 MAG: BrnT family toxin [Alphaproteobacteria bacterium]TAF40464.1 MAG: BrnT family toxin [Alphaproteobacteria bacterium]TAF76895.1 MAG: BrnT family toxin [Alphaproteobacteria bacterium]
MEYEWDEEKCISNITKHHVDFAIIFDVDWSAALIMRDMREDYGEERYLAYVPINNRLHAVIYTPRDNTRRIISLRKANKREIAYYEYAI